MRNIKQINVRNRTCYFLNGMINIEDFDLNVLKIDKKPYKNFDTYFIGYTKIKIISDYNGINNVNPLLLVR